MVGRWPKLVGRHQYEKIRGVCGSSPTGLHHPWDLKKFEICVSRNSREFSSLPADTQSLDSEPPAPRTPSSQVGELNVSSPPQGPSPVSQDKHMNFLSQIQSPVTQQLNDMNILSQMPSPVSQHGTPNIFSGEAPSLQAGEGNAESSSEPRLKYDRFYRARHNYTVAQMLKLLESAPTKADIESILEERVAELISPRGYPWIPLLDALQKGPKPYLAMEVFNWKRQKAELGDPKEYAKMIANAGKLGQLDVATELFTDMEKKGLKRTQVTCNALMSAYAKGDKPDEALSVFRKMQHSEDCRPTLVSFNTLISMYSKIDVEQMEYHFDLLKEGGFRPDKVTYNSMIWGYMRARDFEKMEAMYNDLLKDLSIKPDPITFNAMVIGFARANALEKMETTFNSMQEAGFPINVLIGEIMVEFYALNRKFEKMERIMKVVNNTPGIECSSRMYGAVVQTYAEVGRIDEMEASLKAMFFSKRVLTSAVALEAVITAYGSRGHFDLLEETLQNFKSVGWVYQTSTFHTLLYELGKGRRFDSMEEVFAQMHASHTQPTCQTYQIMADSYDSGGDKAGLLRTIDRMKAAGYDVTPILEKDVDRVWTDAEIYNGKRR